MFNIDFRSKAKSKNTPTRKELKAALPNDSLSFSPGSLISLDQNAASQISKTFDKQLSQIDDLESELRDRKNQTDGLKKKRLNSLPTPDFADFQIAEFGTSLDEQNRSNNLAGSLMTATSLNKNLEFADQDDDADFFTDEFNLNSSNNRQAKDNGDMNNYYESSESLDDEKRSRQTVDKSRLG